MAEKIDVIREVALLHLRNGCRFVIPYERDLLIEWAWNEIVENTDVD
jgi:hypothetical protein